MKKRQEICSRCIRRTQVRGSEGKIVVAVRRDEARSAGHGSGFVSRKSLVARAASSVSAW